MEIVNQKMNAIMPSFRASKLPDPAKALLEHVFNDIYRFINAVFNEYRMENSRFYIRNPKEVEYMAIDVLVKLANMEKWKVEKWKVLFHANETRESLKIQANICLLIEELKGKLDRIGEALEAGKNGWLYRGGYPVLISNTKKLEERFAVLKSDESFQKFVEQLRSLIADINTIGINPADSGLASGGGGGGGGGGAINNKLTECPICTVMHNGVNGKILCNECKIAFQGGYKRPKRKYSTKRRSRRYRG